MSASDLSRRSFSRILLIKPSSLGDIVHALPVLNGLRKRYPSARIDFLVAQPFAPLLEDHPQIDGLIRFDRKRFGRFGRDAKVARELWRFLRDLRDRRYDLVVDLQGLFRSGFFARATAAPVRIGPRDAREGARWFYTHRFAPRADETHVVDQCYAVARMLGFEDVPVTFVLPVPAGARQTVRRRLAEEGLGGEVPYAVLAPGARWETKRWPAERFAETAERLTTDAGLRCVVVGSEGERERCERVASAAGAGVSNWAGRTSLMELTALIEGATVVVAHDSAVVHLAAALRRPVVCIVGPTDPRRTGPYGQLDRCVRLDLPCSPCFFRRLSRCPHDHRCMRELGVEGVARLAVRSAESGPHASDRPARPASLRPMR